MGKDLSIVDLFSSKKLIWHYGKDELETILLPYWQHLNPKYIWFEYIDELAILIYFDRKIIETNDPWISADYPFYEMLFTDLTSYKQKIAGKGRKPNSSYNWAADEIRKGKPNYQVFHEWLSLPEMKESIEMMSDPYDNFKKAMKTRIKNN